MSQTTTGNSPCSVLYRRDNQVVIDGNLNQGDQLIINDLLPAIEGMLLKKASTNAQESQ